MRSSTYIEDLQGIAGDYSIRGMDDINNLRRILRETRGVVTIIPIQTVQKAVDLRLEGPHDHVRP